MFSGIVERVGRIAAIEPVEGGARLRIETGGLAETLRPGDSIATAVRKVYVPGDFGGVA